MGLPPLLAQSTALLGHLLGQGLRVVQHTMSVGVAEAPARPPCAAITYVTTRERRAA